MAICVNHARNRDEIGLTGAQQTVVRSLRETLVPVQIEYVYLYFWQGLTPAAIAAKTKADENVIWHTIATANRSALAALDSFDKFGF